MNPSTIAAIYTFAAHCHSGQWSRGYALLCAAGRAWKRRAGIEPRLGYWEQLIESDDNEVSRIYYHLMNAYAEAI